jgi:hypothetical protein
MLFFAKLTVSATVIAFASWLAGRKPALAGFVVALPLTSMLALAWAQMENQNQAASVEFAKSIFLAVPLSLLFFVPFLFSNKLNLGFWQCYLAGFVLLSSGYGIHRYWFGQ